ncbi:MAG: transporter substrate-binding domain-containing protein, partial [Anaerolineae bacterium]|nr:transporter substrate-binding domain-containing protein [Anaerolineae bacterium]
MSSSSNQPPSKPNTQTLSDYFVEGGTLLPDAPSYVKRPADDELFNLTMRGNYCHILTTRQMGKSSLMIRTGYRLEKEGVRTAKLDLTNIGISDVETWYLDLLDTLTAQLKLSVDLDEWWQSQASLGVIRRFNKFLLDVVLEEIKDPIVIFVDEIDYISQASFSDDFFAAIRSLYNARARDPIFKRLTFVLIGLASASDLIQDRTRTPFNIGQNIILNDFAATELATLQKGLETAYPAQSRAILDRIYYWTDGHPYLTQKLCKEVVSSQVTNWSNKQIDHLVEQFFLSEQRQDTRNIPFVKDYLTSSAQNRSMLNLYKKIYQGQSIKDDPRSSLQQQLKLSGIVKVESNCLRVRNKIYRQVFDTEWVNQNIEYDWTYIIAGVAIGVAFFVILVTVGIFLYNFQIVPDQAEKIELAFYQADGDPAEQVSQLAALFELEGFLGSPNYDSKAVELFTTFKDANAQLALFDAKHDGVIAVIRGLYKTLANASENSRTDLLLHKMEEVLKELDEPQLKNEINQWLQGRSEEQSGRLDQARRHYDEAIRLNSENPSTLFERARLLVRLPSPELSLQDLDRLISTIGDEPPLTPTIPSPSPTLTPTHTPTFTPEPTSTPSSFSSPMSTPSQTSTIDTSTENPPTVNISPTNILTTNKTVIIETPRPPPVSVTPVVSPTPTATPMAPFIPEFATTGQIVNAMRILINSESQLAELLMNSPDNYANLVEFGLVPPTPTSLPTPTSTSTPSATSTVSPLSISAPTFTPSPTFTPVAAPTTVTPQLLTAIERIRDRGFMRVGVLTNFPPFGFTQEDGDLAGFDIDLSRAIAEQWGIEVEFVPVAPQNRIMYLLDGEVDLLAASMVPTVDRAERINFSESYFQDGQSLLVRRGSGIDSIADLEGKTVAVIAGSTSADNLLNSPVAQNINLNTTSYNASNEVIESLRTGSVDAFTTDSIFLVQIANENPDLVVVGGLFTEEFYALGLPTHDPVFRDLVNFTLQELKVNGTYNSIYASWFGTTAMPYPIEIFPGIPLYDFNTAPTNVNVPEVSIVDKIAAGEPLVVGIREDAPPFGFLDDSGEQVGFEIDLTREFIQRWSGNTNVVQFRQVTAPNRIVELVGGSIDILAASMKHTKERDEQIDFSQTYFLDGQRLLVRAEANINGLDDLAGKTIAAIEGTTSIVNTQQIADQLNIIVKIMPVMDHLSALTALEEGQIDAFTGDTSTLIQFTKEYPELIVVGERFTQEPYGIGLPQGDDRFRNLVNFTLQEMERDGTYDAMYCQWFPDE